MLSSPLSVKEGTLQEALLVHASIPEFNSPVAEVSAFETRYEGKRHVIHLAYQDETPIGYMISYDRFEDGSIYCWMAGVLPEYRQLGALSKMMDALEQWCHKQGKTSIKIKTRNSRREMLHFLVKRAFNFVEVIPQEDIKENRIVLEKSL